MCQQNDFPFTSPVILTFQRFSLLSTQTSAYLPPASWPLKENLIIKIVCIFRCFPSEKSPLFKEFSFFSLNFPRIFFYSENALNGNAFPFKTKGSFSSAHLDAYRLTIFHSYRQTVFFKNGEIIE